MTPPKRKKKHVHRYNWCCWCDGLAKNCGSVDVRCKCGKVRHEKNS